MTATPLRTGLSRVASALRDGWLMLGITLGLFLVLEFGFRGAKALRGGGRPAPVDSTLHPYAGEAWWKPFQGPEGLLARRNRYDPYRGFWAAPATGRYVTVDSAGRRVTPQPEPEPPRRQLFLLGGSTMWGFTARDSFTIAAYLAPELRARGVRDVEVVNLAQGAYNTTQELNTLVVELAHGHVPAAAVFLDGYNDIATAVKYGAAGRTYGEESVNQQIDLGRRGFWGELIGLGRHSRLIEWLQRRLGILPPPPPPARGTPQAICGPVGGYYRNVARAAEALGRAWGFPTVYFLQPIHATSRKRRTPWEASLYRGKAIAPCAASIDSAMADRAGQSYYSLSSLFDQDTVTIFVDENAHLTEAANRRVAERIADVVVPLLARRVSRP